MKNKFLLINIFILMGITHSSKQNHKLTEGRMPIHRKKESLKWGHPPSMTKLGEQKIFRVGGKGSGYKYRALKLNEGNFMLYLKEFQENV